MPITDTNLFPYFDDYSELKDYYRILFRPGQAVQARELTQVQSILQNQIDRFGKHIFQNGSLVVGGMTTINFASKYLKIKDTVDGEIGSLSVTASSLVGQKILIYNSAGTGNPIGEAFVVSFGHSSGVLNDLIIINEIYGSISATTVTGNNVIKIEGDSGQDAEVATTSYYGTAAVASINEGIFFVDGFFSRVDAQSILIDSTNTPSKKIGLEIAYSFVDANSDTSLLDNSAGFDNYAEPGAHRLKLSLTLATRPLDSAENLTNFIELIRVDDGVIIKQILYPEYSELEKTLARRTYDESGSYTVRPFLFDALDEFLGTGTLSIDSFGVVSGTGTTFLTELDVGSAFIANDIAYTVTAVGSDSIAAVTPFTVLATASRFVVYSGKKLTYRLGPGKAYIKGREFETIAPTKLIVDKARVLEDVGSKDISLGYGGYVATSNLLTMFDFSALESVDLLNYNDAVIGTAAVYMVAKNSVNYKIYPTNIVMNSGKIFGLVRKISKTGVVAECASVDMSTGSVLSVGTGTATISGSTVTGVGSKFLTEAFVGSQIIINNEVLDVLTITNDLSMTVHKTVDSSAPTAVTIPAIIYHRDTALVDGNNRSLIFPIGLSNVSNVDSLANSSFNNSDYYIRKTLSTTTGNTATIQFTVAEPYGFDPDVTDATKYQLFEKTGSTYALFGYVSPALSGVGRTLTLTASTVFDTGKIYTLYATLNVETSTPLPNIRSKVYNDYNTTIALTDSVTSGRRYESGYNWANNNFTLGLNKSDVKSIRAVYLNPVLAGTNVDTALSIDITINFELDNGQRDSSYEHASISLKKQYRSISNNFNGPILVLFDYWEHSSSTGMIVSRSYSDYAKISTYTSGVSGKVFILRDCVDFRPIRADNGDFISAEIPYPFSNYQSDVAHYFPRRDVICLSANKTFKVLSGVSATAPSKPNINEDLMVLYNIYLNAYTYSKRDLTSAMAENKRYTMRDIGRIEKRVENLEYYTALSLLEKTTADLIVRDGAGNERFKNGFIADNFTGHKIGDVSRSDYSCAIDYEAKELRPRFLPRNFKLHNTSTLTTTSDPTEKAVQYGNLMLLPVDAYKLLISQLSASGYVNVNPYAVFSWIGQLKLDPTSDFWTETTKRPDLHVNIGGDFDQYKQQDCVDIDTSPITEDGPPNPLQDECEESGSAFLGTRWNDWEVSWTGVETTSETVSTRTSVSTTVTRTAVGTEVRTGTVSTLVPSSSTVSLGSKIVDVSVIPFIRSNSVALIATSLKPNTGIYVFFDSVNVTSLITPASGFGSVNNLVTNGTGQFEGTLALPNPTTSDFKFRTGDKLVRVIDDANDDAPQSTTSAQAIYSATGIISSIEETIATIRGWEIQTHQVQETQEIRNLLDRDTVTEGPTNWVDPIAQTVMIDARSYPEGVFVSSIDLYFKKKDQSIPVTIQIRPTVNGYPHSAFIMPYGSKTISPASVAIPANLGDNDSIVSSPTTVTFDCPVYLQPGEYAIVVIANTNNYEVYTAEIGMKKLGKQEIISEQPYLGSFFKSQNSSTWTAEQTIDLMFQLNICEFTANKNVYAEFVDYKAGVTKPYLSTTYMDLINIGNTYLRLPSTTVNHDYTSKKTSASYSNLSSNFIPVDINTNLYFTEEREILPGTVESFRYRNTLRTSNKYVSPIIDLERVNVTCVENIINAASDIMSYRVNPADSLPTFTVGNPVTINSNIVGVVTGASAMTSVTFHGATGITVATSTIQPGVAHGFISGDEVIYYNGGGTSIGGFVSGATSYYAHAPSTTSLRLYDNYYRAVAGGATGLVGATGPGIGASHKIISSRGSLEINKTSVDKIAPNHTFISETSGTVCTVVHIDSENNVIGGGAETRYFTRVINFINESDYLAVYLTAVRPPGTDIKVYYKTLESDSSGLIDDAEYELMVQETPDVNNYSFNEFDFREYVYKPSISTSLGATFNKMVIKIVLLSNNSCVVPRVKDLRAIALDIY